MSLNPAIQIRDVTKRFGTLVAVDRLSLTVPAGSIYGFIGPNGSGKTTTIRMILNILLPDEGEIEVLGSRETYAARDRVGYLPEERGLYKKMQVRRLLRYYGRLKGRSAARVERAIDRWLAAMGLAAWADKRVEALSKGMAQKVQFIASVVSEPELVILDEPFTGLDPVNAEALKDAVLDLRRAGTTIVFSTHDMATAEKMCDRIFMIFKGRKVLDGSLEEIQARYGLDTVRVRIDGGPAVLQRMPEVVSVNDYGRLQEVRLRDSAQRFLTRLASETTVHHFEVTRPSLHDIFVRIARPIADEDGVSHDDQSPVVSDSAPSESEAW
jgi:ABC-2 type transport system ATP-binding protein